VYRVDFELRGLPALGLNSRRHWRRVAKENGAWTRAVRFAVLGRLPTQALEQAELVLTRYSSVEIEGDNLQGSFKPIRDALELNEKTAWPGVFVKDDRRCLGIPTYRWRKAAPRDGHITGEVLDLEAYLARCEARGREPHDLAAIERRFQLLRAADPLEE